MPEGKTEEAKKEPKVKKDEIVRKETPKAVKEIQEPRKFMVHPKRSEKVAICGFAPTSKDLAPFQDPTVEIWGCNELYNYIPRIDVLFEIHDREEWGENFGSNHGPKHVEWMRKTKTPIYMTKHYDDIPTSIPWPLEPMKTRFGDYFTNTITYMIILAIAMEYKWIGLFGIDMAHITEYGGQRPSCEFYLGWAFGLGEARGWPTVYIPKESDLMKTTMLYGYDAPDKVSQLLESKIAHFQKQHATYANQERIARDTSQHYLGAAQGLADFGRTLVHK